MTLNGVVLDPATEEYTYELRATYLNYDVATGRAVGRDEVIGSFVRKPHAGGEAADAFEWIGVRIGHANSREAPIEKWRDLAYAKGFSYVLDFEAKFEKLPIDFGSVPHDPDGWFFYIHITEAHFQFDFLRTKRYGKADQIRNLGDSVVRDSSVPWELEDFQPFVTAQYDRSSKRNLTKWVGVCEHGGSPANVMYYRCDNIPLSMEMPALELRNDGLVSYHGHIYIDQDRGVLLAGDFFEHVPATLGYTQCVVHLKLAE